MIDSSLSRSRDVLPQTRMLNHGTHGIHGKRQESQRHSKVSRRGESHSRGPGDSRKVASHRTISFRICSVCSVCSVVPPLPLRLLKTLGIRGLGTPGSPAGKSLQRSAFSQRASIQSSVVSQKASPRSNFSPTLPLPSPLSQPPPPPLTKAVPKCPSATPVTNNSVERS